MARYIILLHSTSVIVYAGRGYFNLALIFVCITVHDSVLDEFPLRISPPHLMAVDFRV